MWKKLFYDASKRFANDVSRAYAKEKKKQIIQNKEQKLIENYKRQIISEFQRDYKKQQDVKQTDERLEYLIAVNNMCNYALIVLEAPFESSGIINLMQDELEGLRLKTLDVLHMDDFKHAYFTQLISKTVDPFTTLSNVMFGNGQDLDGVIGILLSVKDSDQQNVEDLNRLLNETKNLVSQIKIHIRNVFEESKRSQVVSYSAYGETGEVDFGRFTINDLV